MLIMLKGFLLSSIAMAASPSPEHNHFACKGPGGIKAGYSASSFAGIPLMHYHDGQTHQDAELKSIKLLKGLHGKWVQGRLKNGLEVALLLRSGSSILSVKSKKETSFEKLSCASAFVHF